MLPILYSYRRCPYAMRARMALKLAQIEVDIREVSLRNKPAHMLQISPKGTVPVLQLPDGSVIDESMQIMFFALKTHALGANTPGHPLSNAFQAFDSPCIHAAASAIITENDNDFKRALDAYKYPERNKNKTQIEHRADGEVFLQKLENLLQKNQYLFGAAFDLADIAIFPFIRQFAAVDAVWWETSPYLKLRVWLKYWVEGELFNSVMEKQPTYRTGV